LPHSFATTASSTRLGVLEPLIHPGVESVAIWQGGAATTHVGIDGFRKLWLDWLEPWSSYHVRVDELIDAGDRIVVLIRDRARPHDAEAEPRGYVHD
jgi:hypothetical protein